MLLLCAALQFLSVAHGHAASLGATWSVQIDTSALSGSPRDISSPLPIKLVIKNNSANQARWVTGMPHIRPWLDGNETEVLARNPVPHLEEMVRAGGSIRRELDLSEYFAFVYPGTYTVGIGIVNLDDKTTYGELYFVTEFRLTGKRDRETILNYCPELYYGQMQAHVWRAERPSRVTFNPVECYRGFRLFAGGLEINWPEAEIPIPWWGWWTKDHWLFCRGGMLLTEVKWAERIEPKIMETLKRSHGLQVLPLDNRQAQPAMHIGQ